MLHKKEQAFKIKIATQTPSQTYISTLPYPTLPYHSLPYPTLPYPTLPNPTLPNPTLPKPTLPYPSCKEQRMISEIYTLFFKASLTICHTAMVSQKKSGTSKKIQWDFQISRVGSLDFLDLKVNGSPEYSSRCPRVCCPVWTVYPR